MLPGSHVNVDRILREALFSLSVVFKLANVAVFGGALLWVAPLAAQEEPSGDAYGRLNRPYTLSVGAGGGATLSNSPSLLALLDVRFRYVESIGVILSPGVRANGDLALHLGIEFRPLFWWRFLQNKHTGSSFSDLWLDSIGIEAGASYIHRSASSKPGWMLGLGSDLPLGGARHPSSVFLHVGFRYVHCLASDYGGRSSGFRDLSAYVTLNTMWTL